MRGITEKAVYDIYKHVVNTPKRDFWIRISGLEIYNENVRDLLNSDSGRNLKLLDDPEKGTVVEKLVEETANDDQHIKSLISICEAQRQVRETTLNDTSSRSHQIIRLTIESTLRENSDCCKHTITTVDCQPSSPAAGMLVFVDGTLQLAGEQHLLKFSQTVDEIYKVASISLGSNVPGQIFMGVMVNPPKPGDISYDMFIREMYETEFME